MISLEDARTITVVSEKPGAPTIKSAESDRFYGAAGSMGQRVRISTGAGRNSCQEIVEFGPFSLRPKERLLERDGVPLNLGSRALDILILLVEHAGEVVNKRDLIARAWQSLVVDEGSLRFHITMLRKALGNRQSGARYVTNVVGRGYCFAAPVSRARGEATQSEGLAGSLSLPAPALAMSGRDEPTQNFSDRLRSYYRRLSPLERLTLRRLSVFGEWFSLEAAQSVSAVDADHGQLAATITALVETSLVIADVSAVNSRYRVPETTRAYLLLKLTESGERDSIMRRHATYYAHVLGRLNAKAPHLPEEERLALYAVHVRDARSALQWCFSEQGDVDIGKALAAAAIPLLSKWSFQTAGSSRRAPPHRMRHLVGGR